MRDQVFHGLCGVFLIGVSFASFIQGPWVWFGCIPFYVCVLIFLYNKAFKKALFFFILGGIFCLGVLRFNASETYIHPLDIFINKTNTFNGFICGEPEDREFDQRFCFKTDASDDRILVRVPRFPVYKYGDRLSLSGKINFPENFSAYEGGPEFDYLSYLKKDSIRYVMVRPKVLEKHDGSGSFIVSFLIKTKSLFTKKIETLMSEPSASLVEGILIGEKGALPKDISDNFRRTGLTHILVLSGSNVTVVAESLLSAFSFMPRMYGQGLGAISIVLFAIMTGASTTTVRATFMVLIGLLARGTRRRYDVVRALSLAGVLMVIYNPRVLAFDISFQLSFLATIAIIYVSPLVKERLGFITERFAVRETLAMTIGTQIFTLPFILYQMGEISVVALIPNLLVLPFVPIAMLGGFISGMIGFVSEFLSYPFAWMTEGLLSYVVFIVNTFGGFSFATIKTRLSAPLLIISYAGIIYIIWRLRNSSKQNPNLD